MKKYIYKNEDLIQQVQNYLNKILAETGNRQKKLKESINNTLEILKEDLKLVQKQSQEESSLTPQTETGNENNENADTTPKVEKTNEATEITKQDNKTTEINNTSEPSDTKNNHIG